MDKYEYRQYLNSDNWKIKRDSRVLFDGKKCVVCGRPFDLNVHHLTYRNVPYEKIADVITLCNTHHEEIERRKNNPGRDSYEILQRMLASQFCEEYEQDDISNGGKYDFCNYSDIAKLWLPFLKEHIGTVVNFHGWTYIQEHFSITREKEKRQSRFEEFIEEYKYRDCTYKNGDLNLMDLKTIREAFTEFCNNHNYALDMDAPVAQVREYFRYGRYEIILKYYDQGAPISITMNQTGFSRQMITKVYNKPEIYRNMLSKQQNN